MQNNQDHWNHIYTTRAEDEVSWFQPYPKTSMAFVELFHLSPDANIVDIGGGDSHFVDALLDKGYKNIYLATRKIFSNNSVFQYLIYTFFSLTTRNIYKICTQISQSWADFCYKESRYGLKMSKRLVDYQGARLAG